jgi:hypothetical protein
VKRHVAWALCGACVVLGWMLGGCSTPSIKPLYSDTKAEVIAADELVGEWIDADPKNPGKERYLVERLTEPPTAEPGQPIPEDHPTYTLTLKKSGEREHVSVFDVHAVRLGDRLFLDIYPETNKSDVAEKYGLTYLPMHVPLLWDLDNGRLRIWQTSASFVAASLKDVPGRTPHVWKDDVPVLTGTPRQVQQFMQWLVDQPGALEEPVELRKAGQ